MMRTIYILFIVFLLAGCAGEKKEVVKDMSEEETITAMGNHSIETLIFYSTVMVVEKSQPPHIVVAEDKLDFGRLPQGMAEKKEVLLENNKKRTVTVYPVANGSISRWISFEKEEFTIPPEGNIMHNVFLRIPPDAEPGNYTGYVTFIIKET